MQIELTRKFQKQVENCHDKDIKSKVYEIIRSVMKTESMIRFHNLKKLTGYKYSYRIKQGDYRIGLLIKDKTVVFAAFDHRSDIYKYFP
jgi:mRNA interferase RelE/StbE